MPGHPAQGGDGRTPMAGGGSCTGAELNGSAGPEAGRPLARQMGWKAR